jgi:hypothetical protein
MCGISGSPPNTERIPSPSEATPAPINRLREMEDRMDDLLEIYVINIVLIEFLVSENRGNIHAGRRKSG